jgi:iron complex outermembrane receptor protein
MIVCRPLAQSESTEITLRTNASGTCFYRHKASALATAAFVLGVLPGWYASADAAEVSSAEGPSIANSSGNGSDKDQEEVVVTGSLIPRAQAETATPVTVISSEDIQSHGFADIAEALQRASFSTGNKQDGQYAGGFSQGAKVISLFGLDPSFTKYLIDGRPFADYPALFNGAENFVSISGIPTTLIDHIDVLPGAQSSIYGSDAIAGVVNVVMKKNLDGPVADVRYGWTSDGGGTDRRFALGDGLKIGSFNLVAGLQYENTTPIWGYQRSPTSQYYAQGTSAQTAERDYLLFGYYGQANGNTYYFADPANCANVASQFGHSESLQTRAGRGQYCGTVRSGFWTVGNADEGTQGYVHATQDVNDKLQIFADALINHDVVRFNVGQHFYASNGDNVPFSYYEDPNLPVNPNVGGPDFMNIQHIFSPEEAGGLNNTMDKDTSNTIRGTVGVQGELGSSWRYILDFTYSENKLTEVTNLLFAAPVRAYFASLMGPQLGYDSANQAYIYSPDYTNFYKPLTPAQYASFDGDAFSHSRTEESVARTQVTNTALFSLPGGDAGLALQFDGGRQGWDYSPDPRYFDGSIYGYTSVGGTGHRSRYAGTAELQLPIVSMLTANVSGRYDDYHLAGGSVDKATYNLGLQFRPLEQLLFRGRYGTAFKSPTLADEFQGKSGNYQTLTDYYYVCEEGIQRSQYRQLSASRLLHFQRYFGQYQACAHHRQRLGCGIDLVAAEPPGLHG